MEEAVVEALVLVALIAIATTLGAYMVYTSTMIAWSMQQRSARAVAEDIEASILQACTDYYSRTDLPRQYDSVVITVKLTGRSTVWLRPWGIIVKPGTKAETIIDKQGIENLCSLALGRPVTLAIQNGSIVGTSVSLELKLEGNTLYIQRAG